ALVYSTYLGGSNFDVGFGITVDANGNAYVIGSTVSTNFPTADPIQPTIGGLSDAFVAKFSPDGSELVYSTYLGGSGSDGGTGIAIDADSNAHVTGNTSSVNFPTANPLQPSYGGGFSDTFVAKISPSINVFTIQVISGTTGTVFGGQSFNETRGVDVSVLTSSNLLVLSMTLNGLNVGQPTFVGARIYDSSTTVLIASADTTVVSSGPVTIPISATLVPGASYRLAFFVQAGVSGSGDMFDPDPPGSGGFPYIESTGSLRLNSAHSIISDSFPKGPNIFVPMIDLDVVPETPNP
ncbi:MAG: SBBP repeat-containing protein, partial [Candidatus Binatia bacterium]